MRKVYYNPLPTVAPALPIFVFVAVLVFSPFEARPQQQPPLRGASVESHDGLTISVLPWTDAAQYKEKFPKKAPLAGGVVAIHVSFRNDTAESVRISLEKIRLSIKIDEETRQELPAIRADQVADAVFQQRRDPTAKVRLPVPIAVGGGGRDKKWQELQKAAASAELASSVVAPHSTAAGLLYFDLRSQLDLLNSARLYVPDIVALEKNHQFLFFDVELSRR